MKRLKFIFENSNPSLTTEGSDHYQLKFLPGQLNVKNEDAPPLFFLQFFGLPQDSTGVGILSLLQKRFALQKIRDVLGVAVFVFFQQLFI